MKTIAITNHKGGSAKTTTVVNVAAALGELDRDVLVIDIDPQGSATTWLGVPLGDRSILDAYLNQADLSTMAWETNAPGVQVVPASQWMVGGDRNEEVRIGLGIIGTLERLPSLWDYVLVDCPPTQASLALAPLAVCRNVIIPVETRVLALTGLVSLIGTMDAVRERLNPGLTLDAIVACRVNRTRHAREIVKRLREHYGALVLDTVVRETISLAEAPSFQLPITRYAPNGSGAEDYRAVAREIIAREHRAELWADSPVETETRPTFRLDRTHSRHRSELRLDEPVTGQDLRGSHRYKLSTSSTIEADVLRPVRGR